MKENYTFNKAVLFVLIILLLFCLLMSISCNANPSSKRTSEEIVQAQLDEIYTIIDRPFFKFAIQCSIDEPIACILIDEETEEVLDASPGGMQGNNTNWTIYNINNWPNELDRNHLYTLLIIISGGREKVFHGIRPTSDHGTDLGLLHLSDFSYAKRQVTGQIDYGGEIDIAKWTIRLDYISGRGLKDVATAYIYVDGSFKFDNLSSGLYSYSVYNDDSKSNEWLGSGTILLREESTSLLIHFHNFDYEYTKKPTCLEEGEMVGVCSCGETDIIVLDKGVHRLDTGIVSKEATCTETGEKAQTCEVCGQLIITTIPATGHNWGNEAISREATCTETGEKTYTCSKCGATKTVETKALGHSFTNEWSGDKDNHWHACERCGEIASDSLRQHSFYNHRCTGCGTYEERYIADYLCGTWNSSYIRGLLSDYWIFTNEWDEEKSGYKGVLCWKSGSQESFCYNVFGTKITFDIWENLPFTDFSMISETKFTCLDANYPKAGTITHEKISESVNPSDLSL